MPRNRVINRRNLPGTSRRRTLWLSDEATTALAELAKQLEVSQGSLLEVAVGELAALPSVKVVTLLRRHKQLTDDETKYVLTRLPRSRV